MAETIDYGDPAFPQGHMDGPHINPSGMSLIQFATIEIMKGLVSNPAIIGNNPSCGWSLVNCTDEQLAGYAVKLANHALKAVDARKEST